MCACVLGLCTHEMMGNAVACPRSALAKNQEICAVAQIMPLTMPGKVASA